MPQSTSYPCSRRRAETPWRLSTGCAGWRRPTMRSSSMSSTLCPSEFSGPAARPRATAWKTRGSYASATVQTGPTTRRTRRSMAGGSHRTCWRPRTSEHSPSPSSRAPRRGTRAWRCFPGALAAGTQRCPATTGRATRSLTRTTGIAGADRKSGGGGREGSSDVCSSDLNKGMALFPRRIGGRYTALSRHDRESNAITYSDDRHRWGPAVTIHAPTRPWELVQLGNCGSPIETPAGWLVFTHGVGPMREYAIGAILLDLDEPERLISALPEPLLMADESERDGYVPNVVYSCGSILHGEMVVLPYACSDSSVRIATVDVARLLERLTPG